MRADITRRGVLALAVATLFLTLGAGSPAVSFKRDGEALTSTYAGTIGSASFTGTLKGNAIDFAFEVDAQRQAQVARSGASAGGPSQNDETGRPCWHIGQSAAGWLSGAG